MKILLGHTHVGPNFGELWVEKWVLRLRIAGFDVEAYSLAYKPDRPVIYFDELNILWRHKDKRLLNLYAKLKHKLTRFDVFVCFNGANIHPDFASILDPVTVYGCFDDPESSNKLSKPVVHAFDIAMIGNIAEVQTYRDWGVPCVHWWPLGFRVNDYCPNLSRNKILNGERSHEVVLLCERVEQYRKERVDKFASQFPAGAYYGRGWPSGFLSEDRRIPLLQDSQIGINIHNSSGPINFRTFYLPANGVMQVCDNKHHLGKIFLLGKEVLGFDTIDEAIDITRYYLNNEYERRIIAANGFKRVIADYNEVACFKRMTDVVANFISNNESKKRYKRFKTNSNLDLNPETGMLTTISKNLSLVHSKIKNRVKRGL